jgi:hypothetical protein
MRKPWTVFLAALALSAASAWSADKGSKETYNLGLGYDEGLVARAYIRSNIAAYVGFGYYIIGADTIGRQPLGKVDWKIGGEYVIKTFEKIRFNAFGEWCEEMTQGETAPTIYGNTKRYSQWNTIFRIGVRPEWFLLDQLSIDYKVGLAFIQHGSTFKLNASRDNTENAKDRYSESGVFCGRSTILKDLRDPAILLNIGITWYFVNLPFSFLKK